MFGPLSVVETSPKYTLSDFPPNKPVIIKGCLTGLSGVTGIVVGHEPDPMGLDNDLLPVIETSNGNRMVFALEELEPCED